MFLEILFLTTAFIYSVFFCCLILGLLKLKSGRGVAQDTPSVSVVIPMHNEEEFILRTLHALIAQNYRGSKQFICVNDRSDDQTSQLVQSFIREYDKHNEFIYQEIPLDSPQVLSPKKRALEKGFEWATGDILMTMDADCRPPKGWMTSMVARFEQDVDIVQGPKEIIGSDCLIHGFQKIDTLGFTLIEGAFFTWQKPMLASAPSLGYRKSVFENVHGFEGLRDLESGDDDMLVHKMSRVVRRVSYNPDPEAKVGTAPVDSWKALFSQRARWASNGTSYDSKMYVLFLAMIYLFFVLLLIAPLLAIVGLLNWIFYLQILLLKLSVDFTFLWVGSSLLSSKNLLKWLPLAFFVQIPLIVWAGVAGKMRWYKW